MLNNQPRSMDYKIHHRINHLQRLKLSLCLALLVLLAGFGSVPAATQCDVYVAAHKSNSVTVINTSTDMVDAIIPVQSQPLSVAITPNRAFAYVSNSGY